MGILLSVVRYLADQTDEEENERPRDPLFPRVVAVSSPNSCTEETRGHSRQWQSGSYSNHSQQMKQYYKVSVPSFRFSPAIDRTSAEEEVKTSVVLIRKDTPPNVCLLGRTGTGRSSREKGEEKEREEGQVKIKCTVVAPEGGRWIKHYSSCHKILLVGEGDFSFSTSLAAAFGWASNMVATSLDSEDFLVKNYEHAVSNIVELGIRKCRVMHEIDATRMANHALLRPTKFDRIVFNFPFAGFFKNLSRDDQLRRHRGLVSLFLKNAKEMVSENGEIHITHKTNGFHTEWNLVSLASSHKLRLIEVVDFNHLDYPGYNTKCGFGGDNNFYCYPSKTYKFGLEW